MSRLIFYENSTLIGVCAVIISTVFTLNIWRHNPELILQTKMNMLFFEWLLFYQLMHELFIIASVHPTHPLQRVGRRMIEK